LRLHVTVAARPPSDHPPLDESQRQGAASLVDNIIGRAVDAVGPNGERITVADSQVVGCAWGVEIDVVIDTPDRSVQVGDLVADLVTQILDTTPALTGWAVAGLTSEELAAPRSPAPGRAQRTRRPRARPCRR
jgi:hypothetical protein